MPEKRLYKRDISIHEDLAFQVALPFFKRLARHFEAAKQYAEAEKYFVRAKLATEAVEMYIRANKWEPAHKVIPSSRSKVSVNYG